MSFDTRLRPPSARVETVGGPVDGASSGSADFYHSIAHVLFVLACAQKSAHDSILNAAAACETQDLTRLHAAMKNLRAQAFNIQHLTSLAEPAQGIWQ